MYPTNSVSTVSEIDGTSGHTDLSIVPITEQRQSRYEDIEHSRPGLDLALLAILSIQRPICLLNRLGVIGLHDRVVRRVGHGG